MEYSTALGRHALIHGIMLHLHINSIDMTSKANPCLHMMARYSLLREVLQECAPWCSIGVVSTTAAQHPHLQSVWV